MKAPYYSQSNINPFLTMNNIKTGLWYEYHNGQWVASNRWNAKIVPNEKLIKLVNKYVVLKEYQKKSQAMLDNFHKPIPKPPLFHRQIAIINVCKCGTHTSNDCCECDVCCTCIKTVSKRKSCTDSSVYNETLMAKKRHKA